MTRMDYASRCPDTSGGFTPEATSPDNKNRALIHGRIGLFDSKYYQYNSMSSRDFPSSEGVEMVLQAGVARLGLPSRHAADIPPSRIARARTTKTQCIKQCNNSRQCTQSTQHKHEHRALHSRTGTNMSGHAMFTRGSHASCA